MKHDFIKLLRCAIILTLINYLTEEIMRKRFFALVLAMLMLTSAASCAKDNTSDPADTNVTSTTDGEAVEKIKVLTGVYTEKAVDVPEGFNAVGNMTPSYDKETGEMRLLVSKFDDQTDKEGKYVTSKYIYKLITYDKDMNITANKDLVIPDSEMSYINQAVISGDMLYYLSNEYTDNVATYYICKYNLTTDEITKSDELSGLFNIENPEWFYLEGISVTPAGDVYLASDGEIVVLNSDFIKKTSITITNWINSMSCSPDGDVYISSYFDDGIGIAKVDAEKGALGTPITVGNEANDIFFGEGYDLFIGKSDGVYGCTFAEDGTLTQEMLLNYSNSDINRSNFNLLSVLDKDTIIGNDYSLESGNMVILQKSADIDLSSVKVVEIATSEYTGYNVASSIVEYNKTHKDSRIVLSDYTKYNTDEDYTAGKTKLMNDVSAGLYKPDIIIGSYYSGVASDFVKKGMYVDLGTFLDSDAELKKDDIFGSVIRAFSTSDGKIWGLTPDISLQTLVARTDTLGGKTSWTLDEMIDYANALPAGTQLLEGLSQGSILSSFQNVFNTYIDMQNNTCDFENESFYKFLNFISTLPKEYNYEERGDNYYEVYQTGKIALYPAYISSPPNITELQCVFNSKDYTLIGYPTTGDNTYGGLITYDTAYMIASCCENTDIAWDFIKSTITPKGERYSNNLPILKSALKAQCETYYDYEFEYYFSGGASWGPMDPDNPKTQEDMTEPGILAHFTEEDTDFIMNYLENGCGSPMTDTIPTEVTNIITEEITSFSGGAKTAEDCARVIQSRVKIWLAEHE